MKLQIALDGGFDPSLAILRAVRPYIDIAEVGTPLIFQEGLSAVRRIRQAYPDLTLLADLKIMDAGKAEATLAFEAGADLVTLLGVTQDATVRGAVAAAERYDKQIVVDMMQVLDPVSRGRALLAMGCHYLCLHTAYDAQVAGVLPQARLRELREELPTAPLVIAGGIGLQTIDAVITLQPEIVVVGGAIAGATDPAGVARAIRERMSRA
ncbi:MAG TPA: 3-hexulose-6-phosphate synthase [Anaerolineae bacterium]|nr:3-hexulose-6-phosphate synthase [Anaerolineae bacterium]